MATAITHPHAGQIRTASGLDVVAGIWLFISAFVITMTTGVAWSNGIVGVVVLILAAARAGGAYRASWMSWFNAILGLWTIFVPWILTEGAFNDAAWNNVITGVAIVILAVWSALATNTARGEYRRTDRA